MSLADARAQLRAATDDTQAAAAARLIREASFRPSRLAVEQVLESGRLLERESGRNGGINGKIKFAKLDGAGVAGHNVDAVIKRVHEQGAAEEFTWELAKQLGLHSYFPAVGRRESGSAYVQKVSGKEPGWDTPDLAKVAERWYREHVPGLSDGAVTAAARTDVQLLHFVDYLIANSDRRGPNMILDERKGTVNWIDSGLVGMGDHPKIKGATAHRLAPELQYGELLDAARKQTWPPPKRAVYGLDPAALAVIEQRLPADSLRAMHALLQKPVDRRELVQTRTDVHKSKVNRVMVDWIGSDAFLGHLLDRRSNALRQDGFPFTPFSS